VASTIELLLLAQQSAFPPPAAWTDLTAVTVTNNTAAAAVTRSWPALPGTPTAGTVYQVECDFGGSFGAVAMGVYAGIAGTYTKLATVDAGFGTNGQSIGGSMSMTLRVTSSSLCEASLSGAIQNISANPHITGSGNVVPLTSAGIVGSIAIAAGNAITIGVNFASSVSGQHVGCSGSTFWAYGAGVS
jgi:hypothetical protein